MVGTKTSNLNKTEALDLVYDFFKVFEQNFNKGITPPLSEFEKYLSKSFTLRSNDLIKCKNLDAYIKRYNLFREYYSKIKFSTPLDEPILSGNQLILHYTIGLRTHEGVDILIVLMAIGVIEDGKIASWTQVTHEKGTSEWDE